jgi:hypothetical protein
LHVGGSRLRLSFHDGASFGASCSLRICPASLSTAARVWAGARCEYRTVIAMLL